MEASEGLFSPLRSVSLLLLLLGGVAIGAVAFAEQRRQASMREKIFQARDAWSHRDVDAIVALFADEGELIVPGAHWRGRTQIREAVRQFAQSRRDVKIDIRRILLTTDQAVVEWRYADRASDGSGYAEVDDAIVIDFADEQILRWREYFDTQSTP